MLAAAEVRHRLLAFLVHVHITGCGRKGDKERGLSELCKGLTLNVHRLTVAFETLVDEPVEQRAAVVAEGGARVRVDSELVFHLDVLRGRGEKRSVN